MAKKKLSTRQKRNLLLLASILIGQGLARYGIDVDHTLYMDGVNVISVALFGVVTYISKERSFL